MSQDSLSQLFLSYAHSVGEMFYQILKFNWKNRLEKCILWVKPTLPVWLINVHHRKDRGTCPDVGVPLFCVCSSESEH